VNNNRQKFWEILEGIIDNFKSIIGTNLCLVNYIAILLCAKNILSIYVASTIANRWQLQLKCLIITYRYIAGMYSYLLISVNK